MSKSDSPQTTEAETSTRRTFLQGLGIAGLTAAAMGSASAKKSSGSATFDTNGNELVLGGRLIVGVDGYDTIAQAWADAESGDTIHVHSSYDAQSVGEQFPIVLDYNEKEVLLTGGHPSGSVIDASHTNENVIEVLGRGMNDYRNNPMVTNLKIIGGDIGLRIRAAPYSAYKNLVFYRTGSHGARIEGYTDPDSGRNKGTFGVSFTDCQAWSCGGDGFRTEHAALPHGTTFTSCKATACDGVGFRLRGYTNKVLNSASQLNHSYGIEARYGKAMLIQGCYIEGNSRSGSYPVDLYAKNADAISIKDCYFNGHTSRSTSHDYDDVIRAINIHESNHLSISDCTARNYRDGFIALFHCEDPDLHCPSHYVFDAGRGLFATDPTHHGNYRPRSDGTILPMDLTNVDPAHEHDTGYHVGADIEGPAVCRNGEWRITESVSL